MSGESTKPVEVQIGEKFVEYFYSNISVSRDQLINIYADNATLCYEGTPIIGKAAILEKLKSLPPFKIEIFSLDCQFVENDPSRLMVCVSGQLAIEEGQYIKFFQTFSLRQFNQTSWLITNEFFRFLLNP